MSPTDTDNMLHSPFGNFMLYRYPAMKNEQLRAWDAADEYLLNYLAEKCTRPGRVLLINDQHGALGTTLHACAPLSWGDSVLSVRAAVANRQRNQIETPPVTLPSTATPEGSFDHVLIKIPKATALFIDQLAKLRRVVHKDTVIIAAAMVKHIQTSAFAAFETYTGPVTTSLAVKKARLLFSHFNAEMKVQLPAESVTWSDADLDFSLENLPNVFSRGKLDHGTRFFLSCFDRLPRAEKVIDLGCGNGVLGIFLQKARPDLQVTFVDESYHAVESARRNHRRIFRACDSIGPTAQFVADNVLETQQDQSADLVLCNPPFHQQHVVGQRLATSMFRDSKRVLIQGGQMWVVANRHLDYQASLKRLYGNCTEVSRNSRYRVLRVSRR